MLKDGPFRAHYAVAAALRQDAIETQTSTLPASTDPTRTTALFSSQNAIPRALCRSPSAPTCGHPLHSTNAASSSGTAKRLSAVANAHIGSLRFRLYAARTRGASSARQGQRPGATRAAPQSASGGGRRDSGGETQTTGIAFGLLAGRLRPVRGLWRLMAIRMLT